MTDNNRQNVLVIEANEQTLNLKDILLTYFRFWPWIIISIIGCLLIAFLYLRYATPVYKVVSKILIKDDNTSASSEDMLSDIDLLDTKNNVNNELQVLKTNYMIGKVVDNMNLNIRYFNVGSFKSTEIYKNYPFQIKVLFLRDSIKVQRFEIKLPKSGTEFVIKSDSINGTYHFNDVIKDANISFSVQPLFQRQGDYSVSISTPEAATEFYYNNIIAEIPDKQSNVIQLTLEETVPKKGEDILNKLYQVYTQINQEDKNTTADSTINFINTRLEIVQNELTGVEKDVEQFKTNNQLYTNLQEQGTLALNNINDVQKQLVQQQVQINVIQSIEDHIKNNTGRVVPNAANIEDPTYIAVVEKYNDLVLERDRQLQTSKPDNPLIKNLNTQIEILKSDVLTSLENIKAGMVVAKNDFENKNAEVLNQLKTSPAKERAFLDISRQQDVKQQLYIYLLQKREETAISKSGTLANSRLIEPAKSNQLPFEPNKLLIYAIGFFAGLLIPVLIIYLSDLFNNKITEKKDITKITSVPILGELGHNETKETVIIKQDSRSALSEQFRIIRTNLQFILKGKANQVILITSSMSSEGKSFFSINLACSLAISGKRTVLMEMDLRKPKISKELNLSFDEGFTNYMISDLELEKLAKPTDIHPNLFVIASGTIPPNPAELLLQDKVTVLFDYLKTHFDYIVIDTPPVGIVTDAVLLGNYANASIYIVREKFTRKQQIEIINELAVNNKLPNISILVNDLKPQRGYGYGYGYGYAYGYGYGNGYYSDDKKPRNNFLKKAKKVNKN